MRKTAFILFVGGLLYFSGCQSKSNEAAPPTNPQESPETTTITTSDQDSLSDRYAELLAGKKNKLPDARRPEKGKVNPVDEGLRDSSFFLYRESLIEAIDKKDVISLLEMLDENIKATFGAPAGLPTFIDVWQLGDPEKSKSSTLWPQLKEVLENGGTFSSDGKFFTAPYIFSMFPDEYDAFDHGVISGSGVRIRSEASLNSQRVKSISYEVVEVLSRTSEKSETIGGETHPWIHIKTLDGQEGYVFGKYFRSPLEFRAGFEKKKGKWKMTFFVAGD